VFLVLVAFVFVVGFAMLVLGAGRGRTRHDRDRKSLRPLLCWPCSTLLCACSGNPSKPLVSGRHAMTIRWGATTPSASLNGSDYGARSH